jgi:hypothetical protein
MSPANRTDPETPGERGLQERRVVAASPPEQPVCADNPIQRLETHQDRLRELLDQWNGDVAALQESQQAAVAQQQALREQVEQLTSQLQQVHAANRALAERLRASGDSPISRELDKLKAKHAELEERLQQRRETEQATRANWEQSQGRIAELKAANEELTRQLAQARAQPPAAPAALSPQQLESLPWEERKQHILAQLQREETSASDPASDAERRSLRQIVERTDREIARRDAEIAELQELLEQQSGTFGGVAVGAAAIAEMIDADELVREERTRLQELQKEWEAKQRQAEIDVSLERARIARERQELEKKHALLDEQLRESQSRLDVEPDRPKPRRWLAELGLSKKE